MPVSNIVSKMVNHPQWNFKEFVDPDKLWTRINMKLGYVKACRQYIKDANFRYILNLSDYAHALWEPTENLSEEALTELYLEWGTRNDEICQSKKYLDQQIKEYKNAIEEFYSMTDLAQVYSSVTHEEELEILDFFNKEVSVKTSTKVN